jgi:hypothetical protein
MIEYQDQWSVWYDHCELSWVRHRKRREKGTFLIPYLQWFAANRVQNGKETRLISVPKHLSALCRGTKDNDSLTVTTWTNKESWRDTTSDFQFTSSDFFLVSKYFGEWKILESVVLDWLSRRCLRIAPLLFHLRQVEQNVCLFLSSLINFLQLRHLQLLLKKKSRVL